MEKNNVVYVTPTTCVRFRELSLPCKIGIILGYIGGGIMILAYLIGFVIGVAAV